MHNLSKFIAYFDSDNALLINKIFEGFEFYGDELLTRYINGSEYFPHEADLQVDCGSPDNFIPHKCIYGTMLIYNNLDMTSFMYNDTLFVYKNYGDIGGVRLLKYGQSEDYIEGLYVENETDIYRIIRDSIRDSRDHLSILSCDTEYYFS